MKIYIKKFLIATFAPIRYFLSTPLRNFLKKFYSSKKTLRHDIKSDFRAAILNPLHQLFVGKIPSSFDIHSNQLKFTSDGGIMSIQAYYVGEVEYHLTKYIIDNQLKEGMVFLDIGGHHGAFASIIGFEIKKRKLNGHVYSFEPDPRNLLFLNKNVKCNELGEIVTIVSNAVSSRSEEGVLAISDDNSCNWLDENNNNQHGINISVISIDDYCKNFTRVDLVKIDIQGGEYQAILGMERIINKFKPVIIIEIMDYSRYAKETKEIISKMGYNLMFLNEESKIVSKDSSDIFVSWDVIAIPS